MIPQYSAHLPCVRWDAAKKDVVLDTSDKYRELEAFYSEYLTDDPSSFVLPPDRAAGYHAFLEALGPENAPAVVKGQITGPLTLTTGISDPAGKTLYSDPELRDAAVKLLERNACRQVRRLQQLGAGRILMFADEPVLSAYGSSAYVGLSEQNVTGLLSQVFSAVAGAGAVPGMHICGNSDWAMAMRSGVRVLNFDAYHYGPTLALYAGELRTFLDGGGLIAWGIVPTTDDVGEETCAGLTARLDEAIGSLEAKGLDRAEILDHSLLTPSCGAGGLSVKRAAKVFSLLQNLKAEFVGEL